MRKLSLLLLMLVAVIPAISAHDKDKDGAKREKMFREVRDFKMKYLAKEIDLKEDQQQRFFELYDQMSQKRDSCYKEARMVEQKLKKEGKDASEEDYQKATEAMNKANIESAEIEKRYNEKFSEFLSQKQIFKLKEAEQNFRNRLEEMKHNKRKHPDKIKEIKK